VAAALEESMALGNDWWEGLDGAWKDVFRARFDFKGNPTPEQFAACESVKILSAEKSDITSFAPISEFPKLAAFSFSGCMALKSYEGLPASVTHLTFHWLAPEDFVWLDALPNLEKVYCDAKLQRSLNARITRNRKARAK
jgi:hypothetical protein